MITLSQLLQKGLADLGRTNTFTASGGGADNATRSDLDSVLQPPADNYAINFSLFVNKTTDGLAPEGEFGLVSAYAADAHKYTLAASLSAAIGTGDEIIVADSLFPLREMVQRANRGLEKLGEIWAVDTSLTTAANQREYTLPSKIVRRPELVEIQGNTNDSDDNDYVPIFDWDVIPGDVGSSGLLVFTDQPQSGRKLKIHYGGLHPTITAYSDQISETIHPDVSVALFLEAALEWFVAKIVGGKSNAFWVQKWNDAKRNTILAMAKFPVPKPQPQNKYFTVQGDYYDPDIGRYSV